MRDTYGPEGVTGSEGGGGRLMRVGVDILVLLIELECVSVEVCIFSWMLTARGYGFSTLLQ